MALERLVCLLLCTSALSLSGSFGRDSDSGTDMWDRQKIPVLLDKNTQLLPSPSFRGREEDEEDSGKMETLCGIECQDGLPPMAQTEQERILGYETMYENGTRTHTDVILQWPDGTATGKSQHSQSHARRKRHVYGSDGRFVISDSHFVTNYPFSAAVRLSTGCSGVLVSPKHVLTAAHCIHDGSDYLEGASRLKVGLLQLKSKRRKGGRRKGGRRRGERRKLETGERKEVTKREEEDEEQNKIQSDFRRKRSEVKGRRRRERRESRDGGVVEEPQKERNQKRPKGSNEPRQQPVFRWTQIKQTQIPQGWIRTKSPVNSVSSDYDYALLELKRPVKQKSMRLGVAPPSAPLALIHFSGYDADKSILDGRGDEKVVYRFCSVAKESDDLMYQECDAQSGATGAGVYIRLRQEAAEEGGKGKWQRRVIGVFTGHQRVEMEGGELRDYNVAMRITPPKYAQICHWIHGDASQCKEV